VLAHGSRQAHVWLIFDVRRPHANEARSVSLVYDEPGAFTGFRKSRPAVRREERERELWFSRIDRRRSFRQFSRREDSHRSESKERVGKRSPAEPDVRANAITPLFSVGSRRSSRGSPVAFGKKMSALFFIVSVALFVIALVQGIRAGRRLEEEGRRVGYDFFTRDYAFALFRQEKMPPSMLPHFKKMQRVGLTLLFPSVVCMLVGFCLEGFYLTR
jgi:hypothetical protein